MHYLAARLAEYSSIGCGNPNYLLANAEMEEAERRYIRFISLLSSLAYNVFYRINTSISLSSTHVSNLPQIRKRRNVRVRRATRAKSPGRIFPTNISRRISSPPIIFSLLFPSLQHRCSIVARCDNLEFDFFGAGGHELRRGNKTTDVRFAQQVYAPSAIKFRLNVWCSFSRCLSNGRRSSGEADKG